MGLRFPSRPHQRAWGWRLCVARAAERGLAVALAPRPCCCPEMPDLAADRRWPGGSTVTPVLCITRGSAGSPCTLEHAWDVAGTPWYPGSAELASLPHPTPAGTAAFGSVLLLFLAVFAQLFS